jgi:hypothetical protein
LAEFGIGTPELIRASQAARYHGRMITATSPASAAFFEQFNERRPSPRFARSAGAAATDAQALLHADPTKPTQIKRAQATALAAELAEDRYGKPYKAARLKEERYGQPALYTRSVHFTEAGIIASWRWDTFSYWRLSKRKLIDSDRCGLCHRNRGDAMHLIFRCSALYARRGTLRRELKELDLNPKDLHRLCTGWLPKEHRKDKSRALTPIINFMKIVKEIVAKDLEDRLNVPPP